jgi:hypothetical protein
MQAQNHPATLVAEEGQREFAYVSSLLGANCPVAVAALASHRIV